MPDDDQPSESDEAPARPRPSRRKAALVITPIIILIIGNYAGGALFPSLVNDHPLLLIILSPSNRNFVFVANQIDPVTYFVFGTLRLLAPDPLFFLLGYWYGDAAITWMERRTPTYGQLMRQLERWFSKASWPIVTVIPNNPVCLLAGAAGMSVALFALLDVVGTIGRLVLLKITGKLLANPIGWLLDLIARYRLPLLAVSITLVAFTVIREWRAGTSQIEQLLELEDEMTDGDPTDGLPTGGDPPTGGDQLPTDGDLSTDGDPTDQLPTGGDLPTDGDPTDQRPTDGHATDELPTDG